MGGKGATPAQLEALYRARFAHFVRVAVAICGDSDRGRDVVQNAFISAIRHRRSFRGDAPLEAWVWRIVVNEARRVALEPVAAPPAEDAESMAERVDALAEATKRVMVSTTVDRHFLGEEGERSVERPSLPRKAHRAGADRPARPGRPGL